MAFNSFRPQMCNNKLWYFVGIAGALACSVYFVRKYFAGGRCRCPARLSGKTVIITGANSGIGKETAKALAIKGARVILACRDNLAAIETASEIKKVTRSKQVVVMTLDLSSFSSVRKFVSDFMNSEARLDVLINNAAVLHVPRTMTEDGNEIVFQTNYLGHFLLTMLLLDRLKACTPSRIINVSSMGYKDCQIDFDNLKGEKEYEPTMIYCHSKLAQIYFTRTLSKKLKDYGITVNTVHPGVVDTPIFKYYPLHRNIFMKIVNWPLIKLFFKSAEEGAQTSIHCAISSECEVLTGRYFRDCTTEELQPNALDEDVESRLWSESLKLVGLPQQ